MARSKSVRPIDDGVGPQIDEFFTLAIGGMCTLLNNSGTIIYPGDMLEWTFYNQKPYSSAASKGANRGNANPVRSNAKHVVGRLALTSAPLHYAQRRITVKIATAASERVIGRALSFAKPGCANEALKPLTNPSLTQNQAMVPYIGRETFDLLLKSC